MKSNYLITFIIIFHILNNIIWLNLNTTLYGWDPYWHALTSLSFYNQLKGLDIRVNDYPILSFTRNYYPPLFYFITIPFYFLFGTSFNAAVYTNFLLLSVLIIFTYKIGALLYNKGVGIISAFIISFYPIIFGVIKTLFNRFSSYFFCLSYTLYFVIK